MQRTIYNLTSKSAKISGLSPSNATHSITLEQHYQRLKQVLETLQTHSFLRSHSLLKSSDTGENQETQALPPNVLPQKIRDSISSLSADLSAILIHDESHFVNFDEGKKIEILSDALETMEKFSSSTTHYFDFFVNRSLKPISYTPVALIFLVLVICALVTIIMFSIQAIPLSDVLGITFLEVFDGVLFIPLFLLVLSRFVNEHSFLGRKDFNEFRDELMYGPNKHIKQAQVQAIKQSTGQPWNDTDFWGWDICYCLKRDLAKYKPLQYNNLILNFLKNTENTGLRLIK